MKTLTMILACCLLAAGAAPGAILNLTEHDNLQGKIDAATGGDILLLATGTYGGFTLQDRHFTAERPLVIKAAPGATPVLRGAGYRGHLAFISTASYVVLDGLTLEHCNQPVYCTSVDHCIFVNLVIHDTGQEAIHLRGLSHDVDIRHCRIHDTGHTEPQWAEGIYVGMGQRPYESVENAWIEDNDISATANSEGINLKSRSYHVTIRGNKVHDMAPGTPTQYNEAAISCEEADLDYRPGVDPDIWIEQNEIYRVRHGRWANGIKVSTMGGKIIRNTIHDCEQFGIAFNDYKNGPGVFTAWLYGNRITQCAAGAISDSVLPRRNEDPGANPNRPQAWYAPVDPLRPARAPTGKD